LVIEERGRGDGDGGREGKKWRGESRCDELVHSDEEYV
jgi:hypothetical protein